MPANVMDSMSARIQHPRHALYALLLTTATAATVASCDSDATRTPPLREPPNVTAVPTPSPEQRGKQYLVSGLVTWRGDHPGCALMTTSGGQQLRLLGPEAEHRKQLPLREGRTVVTREQVSGYIPPIEPSPCGNAIPFYVERITAMR